MTTDGERTYSHAAGTSWIALPDNIRAVVDSAKFRKLLKSHYFSAALTFHSFELICTDFVMHPCSIVCQWCTMNLLLVMMMMMMMMTK